MKPGLLWYCMSMAIILSYAKAENQKEPLKNVNLAPFWQWRSAYFCLKNESDSCTGKNVLKLDGVVNVTNSEVEDYCKQGGCWEHTSIVLQCVYYAKRDFWFANKITVPKLKEIISKGCATKQGFSTVNYTVSSPSSGSSPAKGYY
ncbi:hypothetical protein Tsubulata_007334 [Turnera subulata]|uniref:DUF7731 domain-containing protein n=1 Tax=Turnera subulata TaxID=218843 RepID=A0A9Q0JAR6_9ROSI|nr:hypothetical protein Tsubulata_007334 [Turnera subulata]